MVGLNCRISAPEVGPGRTALLMRFPRTAFASLVDWGCARIHGVAEMGYEMALVGSALMSASDPGRLIEAMRNGRGVTT